MPKDRIPWRSRFARFHPRLYLGLHLALGLLLSSLCAWALFAMSEALEHQGRMVRTDRALADWIERHNTEIGEKVMLALSLLGNELLWAILAAATIWCLVRRAWRAATLIVAGGAGGYLVASLLKSHFARGRPIYSVEFAVDAGSFPSGHSLNAVIGYGILAYLAGEHVHHPRRRALLVIGTVMLIILIGLTRLYLDVHYLSDVIAGFAAGGIWLSVCLTAYAFARRWHLVE